jgi:CHAD domain-containing protein
MTENVHADTPEGVRPTVDELLRQMLEDRWNTFARELLRVRRKGTEEAVHDVRVATRRLIAFLDLVSAFVTPAAVHKLRRQPRVLLKALNALRDVQVQRLGVKEFWGTFPILRLYDASLRRRERSLGEEAARAFKAFPLQQMEAAVGRLDADVQRVFDGPALRRSGWHLMTGTAAASFGRAVERRRSIRQDRPETLHRFRVAFKKFRYTIEMLGPAFPWVDEGLHKAMNRYQTVLGEIQDVEVLAADLRSYARRRRVSKAVGGGSLLPVFRMLANRRAELLRQFRQSADDLYRFWEPPTVPEEQA